MSDTSGAPGPTRQVGYLVRNLQQAQVDYRVLGVPRWTRFSAEPGGLYGGRPSTGSLDIALGYVGALQIELIQAIGDGASIWHHDRDCQSFGVHHIAHWPLDYDAALQEAKAVGRIIQVGDSGLARFAYLRTESDLLLELMELTPVADEFMADIAKYGRCQAV